MTMRRSLSHAGLMALILAGLAMTATGFAHRFVQEPPAPALLSYLEMGGTLDEICGTGPDLTAGHLCEACLISANALAPAPHDRVILRRAALPAGLVVAADPHAAHAAHCSTPPVRAPPRV